MGKNNEPIIIRIRGVTYPSANAAARALGVSHQTIVRALDRGTLDYIGKAFNTVYLNGVGYVNAEQAARAIGLSRRTLFRWIRAGKVTWQIR